MGRPRVVILLHPASAYPAALFRGVVSRGIEPHVAENPPAMMVSLADERAAVAVVVEPSRWSDLTELREAIACYHPAIACWEYQSPGGVPRLEPMGLPSAIDIVSLGLGETVSPTAAERKRRGERLGEELAEWVDGDEMPAAVADYNDMEDRGPLTFSEVLQAAESNAPTETASPTTGHDVDDHLEDDGLGDDEEAELERLIRKRSAATAGLRADGRPHANGKRRGGNHHNRQNEAMDPALARPLLTAEEIAMLLGHDAQPYDSEEGART